MRNKGQMINAEGVVGILVLILVIGYVINIGLGLNNSAATDLQGDLTGDALAKARNATTKVNAAYGQASNLPSIYIAILMIGAILSILVYLKYYRGG